MEQILFKKVKPRGEKPNYTPSSKNEELTGWFEDYSTLEKFFSDSESYTTLHMHTDHNPSLENAKKYFTEILNEGPEDLAGLGGWYVALDNRKMIVGFYEVRVSNFGAICPFSLLAKDKEIGRRLYSIEETL